MRTSRPRPLAAALLALALAGCVQPDEVRIASVSADLHDAPPAGATYTGWVYMMAIGQASADGQYWYNMSATLVSAPGGTSVAGPAAGGPLLSVNPQYAQVPLQDTTSSSLHRRGVLPADTYRYVRLVLSPRVGGGEPPTLVDVSGVVSGVEVVNRRLTVTSRTLIVQREIEPVTLASGDRLHVAWDLNSETWITPAALAANRIDTAAVKSGVTLTVKKN
jgi:hypothetical protein